MGHALSSLSECLGDFSSEARRYDRVPSTRRVESSANSARERTALRQRITEKVVPASVGAAVPPPPPPLVPDPHAVYDLVGDDEEVCPTCLENYSADNPRIVSTCGHSFHLQCIVAWETRSGSKYCPICAKPMTYREADTTATS